MERVSVLDLCPMPEGGTPADALRNTADLARAAEAAGCHRSWRAEHHGMPGVASAATAVVIGHGAAATRTIRVGAGGIMLPNHAPLLIAAQFGTLEALSPGRIDLGRGRAPGADMLTARALRRSMAGPDSFPQDVIALPGLLGDEAAAVRAIPGQGSPVPIWLLGSSLFGAQLAACLGLPYAFASHLAPAALSVSATGSPDTIRRQLAALIDRLRPDELIVTAAIHAHAARVRSLRIAAEVQADLVAAPAPIFTTSGPAMVPPGFREGERGPSRLGGRTGGRDTGTAICRPFPSRAT